MGGGKKNSKFRDQAYFYYLQKQLSCCSHLLKFPAQVMYCSLFHQGRGLQQRCWLLPVIQWITGGNKVFGGPEQRSLCLAKDFSASTFEYLILIINCEAFSLNLLDLHKMGLYSVTSHRKDKSTKMGFVIHMFLAIFFLFYFIFGILYKI